MANHHIGLEMDEYGRVVFARKKPSLDDRLFDIENDLNYLVSQVVQVAEKINKLRADVRDTKLDAPNSYPNLAVLDEVLMPDEE